LTGANRGNGGNGGEFEQEEAEGAEKKLVEQKGTKITKNFVFFVIFCSKFGRVRLKTGEERGCV
jgi:hypothetical protein